jgi:hypothetical protein
MPQSTDSTRSFPVGIDQVLLQGADDPVATGVDISDAAPVPARRLDYAAGGCIDHCGDTA